ncbi:hypothetical protein KEM54_006035 [Ascosphaera aggregata]|nr:hypothetical protein KEM54_006035 [Ascosphaera aggregata]
MSLPVGTPQIIDESQNVGESVRMGTNTGSIGDNARGRGLPDGPSAERGKNAAGSHHSGKYESRPPYLYAMLAGGIGGTTGDMLMHSLDTVKTRQQGDPHMPPKYSSMSNSYRMIFKEEGFMRGLYSGVTPAFLGSFPGTVVFFGVYEWTKRNMLEKGVNPSLSYLTSGLMADLAASVIYVPSEVLKTRLQLQGRHNNPFFKSGYNYRSTTDACRTIIRQEGFGALFFGYKATIFRDLPFSALQFAFYEKLRKYAIERVGNKDIGLPLEILTATSAGGAAGVLTCPLDVVKTRIQTQLNPEVAEGAGPRAHTAPSSQSSTPSSASPDYSRSSGSSSTSTATHSLTLPRAANTATSQLRNIYTAPSSLTPRPAAPILDTSSVLTGLKILYQTEGILGWFRGVGPRFVWTSVQSGTMLVLYQVLLKKLCAFQKRWESGRGII